MDTDLCNLGTGGYGSTVYSSLVLFRKNKQSGYKRGRKFVLRTTILRPGFTTCDFTGSLSLLVWTEQILRDSTGLLTELLERNGTDLRNGNTWLKIELGFIVGRRTLAIGFFKTLHHTSFPIPNSLSWFPATRTPEHTTSFDLLVS
jgi:hypothetical protein